MARSQTCENDLHLEATELRLGLPGTKDPENQSLSNNVARTNKRSSPDQIPEDSSSTNNSSVSDARNQDCPPPSK